MMRVTKVVRITCVPEGSGSALPLVQQYRTPRGETVDTSWMDPRSLADPELGRPIRLSTEDMAAGTVTRVRKSIGLGQLRPGDYRLVITIEHDGASAVREQSLSIVAAP